MDCEQLFNLIRKRRSVRNYLPGPIPDEHINKILEAGLYAPSGKNRQPWRFIVVKDVKTIRSIAKATTFGKFACQAPVLVLVFTKTDAAYPIEKDLVGIGACLQNMMLTATAIGYGSCIVGELYGKHKSFAQELVLDLNGYLLICGLAVGKAKSIVECPDKKDVDRVLLISTDEKSG